MAKRCSICAHPHVREIDSLLDGGSTQPAVAQQFGVSISALSRHGRGLCRASDPPDADEKIWLTRLERAHERAVADGDVRGMQQIAATGLRVARQRKIESEKLKAARAASDADSGDNRVSIGSLDEMVALLTQVEPSPVDRPKIKQALDHARALNRLDAESIFNRMWENPRFAQDLTDYATSWKPEEPKDNELIQPQETAARPN
jgi:hypothetical protein